MVILMNDTKRLKLKIVLSAMVAAETLDGEELRALAMTVLELLQFMVLVGE